MSKLVKGIGAGIGMAAEAVAHHQEKSQKNATDHVESHQGEGDDSEYDETAWSLDDVQHEHFGAGKTPEPETRDVDELLKRFAEKHPPPNVLISHGPLPCPVILPQKRPEHKSHGFVRAYAPVLQDCGVDQTTWMDFLDGFGKAIKMHPAFHVANLAVLGAALTLDAVAGPSITAHMVALTIHTSIEGSRRAYIHYETNKYLDGMNQQLFKPHGLYCMVMTYKPESEESMPVVDITQNIIRSVATRNDENESFSSKFKSSSGQTHGEIEIPEAAPLIFPHLDSMSDGEKQSHMKRTGAFMTDYFDRRAQATFDHDNPNSKLTVTEQKPFASRYADPTHPANSGSVAALVTGGAFDPVGNRKERRKELKERVRVRLGKPEKRKGLMGSMKKIVEQDVLYLIVVNWPSEHELQEAKATEVQPQH